MLSVVNMTIVFFSVLGNIEQWPQVPHETTCYLWYTDWFRTFRLVSWTTFKGGRIGTLFYLQCGFVSTL